MNSSEHIAEAACNLLNARNTADLIWEEMEFDRFQEELHGTSRTGHANCSGQCTTNAPCATAAYCSTHLGCPGRVG